MFLIYKYQVSIILIVVYTNQVSTLRERYLSLLKSSELIILKIIWNTQLHCEQNAEFNVKAVLLTVVP